MISRNVHFIEEEACDGSIEKTVNVKSCLSHDDDEEEMAKRHLSLAAPPPPMQRNFGTPQEGMRTCLRSDDIASSSTSQGAYLSASTSTSSASERGTRFRSLNEIYEQEENNEGMNSLFSYRRSY